MSQRGGPSASPTTSPTLAAGLLAAKVQKRVSAKPTTPYDCLVRPRAPTVEEVISGHTARKDLSPVQKYVAIACLFLCDRSPADVRFTPPCACRCDRLAIVAARGEIMLRHVMNGGGKRFPQKFKAGSFGTGITGFAAMHGVHESTVRRIVREYSSHQDAVWDGTAKGKYPPSWDSKRGGAPAVNALLDKDRIDFIMYVNNKSKRRLSIARLAKACQREAGKNRKYRQYKKDKWCASTLANHLGLIGAYWHRRYIDPLVTDKHRKDRIQWVMQEVDTSKTFIDPDTGQTMYKFRPLYDMVHLDEAWHVQNSPQFPPFG